MQDRKIIQVVAGALFQPDGRVLVAQRPPTCKLAPNEWEFPGGKIEPGECPEEALVRELKEELGIQVQSHDLKPLTFMSAAQPWWHVVLLLYGIHHWDGHPQPLIHQGGFQWLMPSELSHIAMLTSNAPLVAFLQGQTSCS